MLKSIFERAREAHTAEIEGEEVAEAGFTLIELMVVLLIIAILLAIAIPTFLGVTSSANDRAAQSNLTNALTEVTAQYQNNNQKFPDNPAGSFVTLMNSSAPEFKWQSSTTACTSSVTNCISAGVFDAQNSGDEQVVVLAALSKTGTCWWAANLQANPTDTTDSTAFLFNTQTESGTGITTAGTYYANDTTTPSTKCEASSVVPSATQGGTGFKWGPSFSQPGQN